MANVVFVNEPPIFDEEHKKLPLLDFIMKYKPSGWEELFNDAYEEISNISEILEREKAGGYRIVPDIENIFKVFYLVNPKDVKVIIWGQDPYHQILHTGKSRAQGLSFSVDKSDDVPGSLLNIYKEIINNYPTTPESRLPKNGDLTHWVYQGVFLLNSCLTTRADIPNAHSKYILWHPFIDKMLRFLSKFNKNIIHILWGKEAQKLEKLISATSKSMLIGPHPSGLSAYRGFIGCGHFKTINDMLKAQGKTEIIWM